MLKSLNAEPREMLHQLRALAALAGELIRISMWTLTNSLHVIPVAEYSEGIECIWNITIYTGETSIHI